MTAGDEIDRERLADLTLRLIGTPSPSGEEGAVAGIIETAMREQGLSVRTDRFGNVIGVLDAGPGPCVLIDAHLDTVGVTDPSAWSHDPAGERAGDCIYGRGAMDMKGPLAAALMGVTSRIGKLSRGRVVLSATLAEEMIEGPMTEEVARAEGATYVVIAEATSLRLARGQRGRAEIAVETSGRATHSSRPELGINAADAMVDVILALRRLPLDHHPILGDGILVLTDILSRPYPALSVVPDRCLATFDRRTLPGETAEDVLTPIRLAIEEAVRTSGATATARIADDHFTTYTGLTVDAPNFAPAWFYEEGAEIVRRAQVGMRAAGLPPELTHYAFCTNGSGTAGRLGIPTIGFGPGDETLAHRSDECIELDALVAGARGYAGIAAALLGDGYQRAP